jgi:hypothetical protein
MAVSSQVEVDGTTEPNNAAEEAKMQLLQLLLGYTQFKNNSSFKAEATN